MINRSEKRTLAGGLLVGLVTFICLGGAKCPDIPLPQPTPTINACPPQPPGTLCPSLDPTKDCNGCLRCNARTNYTWVSAEAECALSPAPVCAGEGKCGCYVQPREGEWKYICCAPWVEGGVLLGDKPSDCPEPPLSLCINPGSDYEVQPQTPAPKDQLDALTAALVAETDCQPMTDCKLPTDPQTFMNRVIARLVAGGLCAGRQVEGGDAIAIGSQNDNWTYHIVNFGGPKVAWPPSKSEPPDHWKVKGVAAPVGFPPMAQFGRGPDLSVRHLACLIVDATPLTRSSEYCKAAFPDNPAQHYLCPFGSEDTPEKRQLGERAAGPYTWTWNGIEWEGNNGNPLQIKVCPDGPGVAKVCAYNYGTQVCQSAEIK